MLNLREHDLSMVPTGYKQYFNPEEFAYPGGKDNLGRNLITALMTAIGGPSFFDNSLRNSLERRWQLFANSDPSESGMNAARAFADWGAGQIGRLQPSTIGGQPTSQMPIWQQQVGRAGTQIPQQMNKGQIEAIDPTVLTGQAGQAGQAGQTYWPGQAGQAGQADQVSQVGQAGQEDQALRSFMAQGSGFNPEAQASRSLLDYYQDLPAQVDTNTPAMAMAGNPWNPWV